MLIVCDISPEDYDMMKMLDKQGKSSTAIKIILNGEPILSFFEKVYNKIEKERENKWQQAFDQNSQRIINTTSQNTEGLN